VLIIKDNIFNITLILMAAAILTSLLLILIRIIQTIWFHYCNVVIKNFEIIITRYLDSNDLKHFDPYEKTFIFKTWIIKKELVYRSFGKSSEYIEKLAKAYRYLDYSNMEIKKTRSPIWFIRAESARCLGQLRIYEAKEAIKLLLKDRRLQVKLVSAWSLGRIGSEDCIIPVMEALIESSKMAGLRLSSSVFEIGEKAVSILIKALEHKNTSIRILAIHLLGEIKSEETVGSLINIVSGDEDTEVIVAACKALGNIRHRAAAECLANVLSNDNWVIRAQAVLALGKIAAPDTVKSIKNLLDDEVRWVRYNAGKALFIMGQAGKEALQITADSAGDAKDMALQWLSEYNE
jgi:HEAT repeat protein